MLPPESTTALATTEAKSDENRTVPSFVWDDNASTCANDLTIIEECALQ